MYHDITTIVTLLTAVFEDLQKYRRLLHSRSTQAQQLLDLFQNLLDNDALQTDSTFRRNLIVAAQRLSKSAQCLPTCYKLGQIELLENDSVAAGSYADIYKARFRDTPVCMKVLRIFDESDVDEFSKEFATEAILWAQLSHANLLPIYGLYTFKNRPCLISPWMENKSINYFLKRHSDANRMLLVLDISMGIEYLHAQDVIHGDLKGANVLVDDAGRARVADFGLSSVSGVGILHWTTHSSVGSKGGSIRWQAPELFDISDDIVTHNSKASDIYAFGGTAYEVLTGNFPFHETARDAQVIQKVQKGAQPSRPPENSLCWNQWGLSEPVWSLMKACWNGNSQGRPSIHHIVGQLVTQAPTDNRPIRVEGHLSALHFRRSFEKQPNVMSTDELKSILDKHTAPPQDSPTINTNKSQLTNGDGETGVKPTHEIQPPLREESSNNSGEGKLASTIIKSTHPNPDSPVLPAQAGKKKKKGKQKGHKTVNTVTASNDVVPEIDDVKPQPEHQVALSNKGATTRLNGVVYLQDIANRWDRMSLNYYLSLNPESPAAVDRNVRGLLNKLALRNFDSISDHIVVWANKSAREKDGRTLIQVIRLIFENAIDEAIWSETYARLCKRIMERIDPHVQDISICNAEGTPASGGQLFRKYLLNRCQEDFERGWVEKEVPANVKSTKATVIKTSKGQMESTGEVVLYSDKYYAVQKAKRQGLGLITFIGELFKLQILTERIIHQCMKRLLGGNVEKPEEEEIERACKLLSTIGGRLDTVMARAHMDVYISRMKELMKSPNMGERVRFMLQDVIELRERKWIARSAITAPATIAQVYEMKKVTADKQTTPRGGPRRGADRSDYPQTSPDGWAVAANSPSYPHPKLGDLSRFGKITRFGPSSVFTTKKDAKQEFFPRTSSSSNMFSMLSSGAEPATEPKALEPQRKRLVLQPRAQPTTEEQEVTRPKSELGNEEDKTPPDLTQEQAVNMIAEDMKELFAIPDLDAGVLRSGMTLSFNALI